MTHRSNQAVFEKAVVAVFICAIWAPLLNAQQVLFEKESLEDVVARDPAQRVQLLVDFHAIQREPNIVRMLDDSKMLLDEIQFKFVGSGGGSMGAYGKNGLAERMSIEEIFDEAELEHRLFFQLLVSQGNEILEVECPIADEVAPTTDMDGRPGEPAIELACGLRIVEMKITGSGGDANAFTERYRNVAEIHKSLSIAERQQLVEQMRNLRCQGGEVQEC